MSAREAATWAALAALTAAVSLLLGLASIPSPTLMAALLVGIGWALKGPAQATLPRPVGIAAEAVVGVAIGAYVQLETLEALGADLPAVIAINVVTLVLSVVAGLVLARTADVDEPTAAFGMVAGGASGIVAMADDLGADARLVAVMQYLRVLVIVMLTPVLAAIVFGAGGGGGGAALQVADDVTAAQGLLFCAVCVAVGVPLGLKVPAGTVLGPMVVAAVLAIVDVPFAGALPALLQDVAFAVIGLAVGLRFTPDSLKAAGRLLPRALAVIAALLVLCAATGVVLAAVSGVSQLTAYLATTPGGLYAVLATAVDSDADATFVLAVQVLRLLVMLLAAPLLARRLTRAAR